MLHPENVESPCESAARDGRMVSSVGVLLAIGGPGHRPLALAVAPIAAISRGRHNVRGHVRAIADGSVSACATNRLPRQFYRPSAVSARIQAGVGTTRTCQSGGKHRSPMRAPEVNHR
jgi:hypothetical protein